MPDVAVSIPRVFSGIVPLEGPRVAIEHAPLDTRLPQALMADLLVDANTKIGRTLFFLTRRRNLLLSTLERWTSAAEIKVRHTKDAGLRFAHTGSTIYCVNPDDFKHHDLPFNRIDRFVCSDAATMPQSTFTNIQELVRQQTCVVGAFSERDSWFYQWARQEGTRLHRVDAKMIVASFPDQKDTYEQMLYRMSDDEIARYLRLEDVEVAGIQAPPYLKWASEYLPVYCDLPMSKMHRSLDAEVFAEMAHDRKRKEVVIGPRDSAKSTHCTEGFPLYAICHGLERYILIISDTTDQAVKHLDVIKEELENNEKIAKEYPEVHGIGATWKNNAIETRNGIRVEALGAGKKIRGRRYQNHRPSLIVGDDLEGDESAYSSKTREHRWDWLVKGVLKAGGPRTNYLIAGSNIHQDGIVAKLHKSPGWRSHLYRSIIKWPAAMHLWEAWERILRDPTLDDQLKAARAFYEENKVAMDEGAEVLWEQRETLYDLMLMRATDGHQAFEAEKQNNPIDPSKCEWGSYLFEDRWFDKYPDIDHIQIAIGALDPSKGKNDRVGDYQGMVSVCIDDKLRCYVDADISRRPMTEMCERFCSFLQATGCQLGVCEAEQFQELLIPEIEGSMIEQKMFVPIEGITTEGIKKEMRIRRIGPWINRGRILFRRGSPGCAALIKMLSEFPNGDHDDGPDAFEMAMRRALEGIGASVEDLSNPY